MHTQTSLTELDRQTLLSVLARSKLMDIKKHWQDKPENYSYETIRPPQTGMVMSVARAGSSGEPFNLGEVSVTRCAIRLDSGETGVGYVTGSNKDHALHIAVIDALAQTEDQQQSLEYEVIRPLQKSLQLLHKQRKEKADATKVDFFTMVRGED
jgi:alpha-D-ribose 1-methylphosphonate 5-triphosphate synthase subunit PhnG